MMNRNCWSHGDLAPRPRLQGLPTFTILACLALLAACRTTKEGGPDPISSTRSLGAVISSAGDRPVHIIYVHGMRATGEGASDVFRTAMCGHISGGCSLKQGTPPHGTSSPGLGIGRYPEQAKFAEKKIWASEEAWIASRPFVDRFVFERANGGPIVIDEVEWWPLLFPLKCQFLLLPEIDLAGPDTDDLGICAQSGNHYYPWIDPVALKRRLGRPPQSGGGVIINSALKRSIMDWGLSDAVMTVGPMQKYFRRAMNAAFDYAAKFEGKSIDDQVFVVISESLGSFVVLDAFATQEAAFDSDADSDPPVSTGVHDVLARTYDLYFFANQFAMLELARIEGLSQAQDVADLSTAPSAAAPSRQTPAPVSPLKALSDWANEKARATPWAPPASELRPDSAVAARFAQIIAFNDPSDMLTFDVPGIPNTKVVNVYDRNSFGFFHLFELPGAAHLGHSSNPGVLKIMFGE